MRYTITHRTLYQYSSGVALCHNEARLLPREAPWQLCRPSQIRIRPRPALSVERRDFFGNRVLYFAIQDVHHRLEVTVATEVRVLDERPFDESSPSPPWKQARQMLWEDPDPEIIEARLLGLDSPFVAVRPALRE
jgi:transglutaminase-like putative cysteine protease